jgi:hypothetical protein
MTVTLSRAAHAQAAVYGEFSVDYMHNLTSTDLLYGATTGFLFEASTSHHVVLSADVQGRFVGKSGDRMDGVTVGPRFSFPLKHGFAPYAEFMIGLARYNNPALGNPATDSTFQVNAGLAKRLTPRFDMVVDYSYAQYDLFGGQFNPKTFSVGTIFHFKKR